MSYQNHERDFWINRHRTFKDIRAVARADLSIEQNIRQYAAAIEQLRARLVEDFGDRAHQSKVLDLGCGQGHYARSVYDAGFCDYRGVDFAATPNLPTDRHFSFLRADITHLLAFPEKFDVVLLIDVVFHVVDPEAFHMLLHNVVRNTSKGSHIYITGLFKDERIADHVLHRDFEDFTMLGDVIFQAPWRDTSIAVFKRS